MTALNNNTLHAQVYIVTGASRGFGLAITKKLLEAGARVGMLAREAAKLQTSVMALATDAVFGVPCDVANKAQVVEAFEKIEAYFGRVNGLVSNAWHKAGPTMNVGMEVEHVAEAVVHCLAYPTGVSIDLLEVRPNQAVPKISL